MYEKIITWIRWFNLEQDWFAIRIVTYPFSWVKRPNVAWLRELRLKRTLTCANWVESQVSLIYFATWNCIPMSVHTPCHLHLLVLIYMFAIASICRQARQFKYILPSCLQICVCKFVLNNTLVSKSFACLHYSKLQIFMILPFFWWNALGGTISFEKLELFHGFFKK